MSRGSPAWRLENGHQIFSELCHVVGETEEQLELSLNIEFEGDVGRRIRHAEQRTRGELPFGHAVFELKIRDRPHPVLLLFETARVREILDLAVAFDAEAPRIFEFVFESPVELELQTVDVAMIPHLADEERVESHRVGTPHIFAEWPKQDLVGVARRSPPCE